MSAEPRLAVAGLVKRFGGLLATDNVDLDVLPGEIHAVIGPNGAGKTTLFGQIAGEIRPDAGSIRLDGAELRTLPVHRRAARGLARSFQITSIFGGMTVHENAALAVQARIGHSFRFWTPAMRRRDLATRPLDLLRQVGLEARAGLPAMHLSGGEKRALEIAMAMAAEPRILLLDEPMAGMGPRDSHRVITLLSGLREQVPILLVEHDMDAVFALADRITVLVRGRVIASGRPDEVRASEAVQLAYLGGDEDA